MVADTSFPVWGTTAFLMVTDEHRMDIARRELDAELAAMGDACDRFRVDSELSRLNAAGGQPRRVSSLFAETLARALEVAEATDGAVDPTVGGALIAAGYDRDLNAVRSRGDIAGAAPVPVPAPGRQAVEIDGRVVRLRPGVRLDLGAVAKALAADRAAARAARRAGCGVLVGLGGDIAACGPPPPGGWRIRVAEDHRAGSDVPGQAVAISGGGMATSSVTVRRWWRDGRHQHHIIDPATGVPALTCWRAVSVAAANCVDANAASTAAVVTGPGADTWLADRRLPARLVRSDGAVLTVAGWPADEPAGAAV